MNEYENEKELMDYLNVIWKRKWLIIIPTFVLVVAIGVYSFFLPRLWEVDAIIQPCKYFFQDQEGQFREYVVDDPKYIAAKVSQRTYNRLIAAELNLDIRSFPELKAENIKDTKLLKISTEVNDVEKAKLILYSLFKHLKRDLDKKVDIELKGIDSQIKSKEIENLRIEEDIKAFKKLLNIVKLRKKDVEKEMIYIRKRVESLEREQRLSLKKENASESKSLTMLLYSNEIQQSLQYNNTLNELLSSKKIEEEKINLEIENKEEKIKQLESEIGNLNERKGRIDYTQLIKEPSSSLIPSKKKRNVMLAGILGLMIFTMFAFFLEYIEKQKIKS
jgi:capsular polysaccharide biosynthesis protein